MKYTALAEGLVTNIALGFASTIFATRLSPQAVYFIQTGSSALSNTYGFNVAIQLHGQLCCYSRCYCLNHQNLDLDD